MHPPLPHRQVLTVPGLVGLSLAYALPITDRLNGLLTVSAETEQEMVAVERLTEYAHLPPQASSLHPHGVVPEQELSLPFQSKPDALSDCRPFSQGAFGYCLLLAAAAVDVEYSRAGALLSSWSHQGTNL